MNKVFVNLTKGEIEVTPFDQKDYGFLGGRGLIAKLLTDFVPVGCDALSPDNPFFLCTGFFSGTILPCSNRLSIGTKSPLTGTVKESNVGGTFAKYMTDHGIKYIHLDGAVSEGSFKLLYIDKNGAVSLKDADKYVGMWNYEIGDALRKDFGEDISIASIGPAGEMKSLASSIQVTEFQTNNPCRAAARGGVGAVLGVKGIKAIVIERAENPHKVQIPAEYEAEFKELNKKVVHAIRENPLTGQQMRLYGSAAGIDVTGKMGALPTKNFSGQFSERWHELESVNWRERMVKQGGRGGIPCQAGCIVACSNEYYDKDGNYLSAGIEYETLGLCGPDLDIYDSDVIVTLDRLCDDMGFDTIEIGNALAVAMENGILDWGDAEGAVALLKSALDDDCKLPSLKDGCYAVGTALGASRIPVAKKQAIAAYDPRVILGYGLCFERSPMGGDHTSGSGLTFRKDLTPEMQADTALAQTATCDSFMCLFPWAAVNYDMEARAAISRMAGILAGEAEGPDMTFIEKLGFEILGMERAFNEREGFTDDDNVLPDFFYTEPAAATGAPWTSPFGKGPKK